MQPAPMLSIIILVNQNRKGLVKCLNSLNLQSLSSSLFEVLLIGDALEDFSTPSTGYKVRVLYEPSPCSAARGFNLGVQVAAGNLILFLDKNTIADSACLQWHIEAHKLVEGAEVGILGQVAVPGELQNYLWGYLLGNSDLLFSQHGLESGKLYGFEYFSKCNFSLQRKSLLAAGLFDTNFLSSESGCEMQEIGVRMQDVPIGAAYVQMSIVSLSHIPSLSELIAAAFKRGDELATMFVRHPSVYDKSDVKYDEIDKIYWIKPPARLVTRVNALTQQLYQVEKSCLALTSGKYVPVFRKIYSSLHDTLKKLGKLRTRDILTLLEPLENELDLLCAELDAGSLDLNSAALKFYPAVLFILQYHESMGFFSSDAALALCGSKQVLIGHPDSKFEIGELSAGSKGRILLSCNYFWPMVGGTELIVEELGLQLMKAGYDVDVVCRHQDSRTKFYFKGMRIISIRCWLGIRDNMGRDVNVYRKLVTNNAYKAVIVLAHPDNWTCCLLRCLPEGTRPRLIMMPSINAQNLKDWKAEGLLEAIHDVIKSADAHVTVSENGIDADVLNSIDLPHTFLPHAVSDKTVNVNMRKRFEVDEDIPLLVCVGNFWPVKNQLELLKIMNSSSGTWKLVIAGAPAPWLDMRSYFLSCWDIIRRDPRIHLAGPLPALEAAALIRDANVLLLPSLGESAGPLVILQAMALGTPWVATPECNSVRDEAGGLIVPLNKFPDAVKALLEKKKEAAELAGLGREHWQRCFTWDRSLPGFLDLIEGKVPKVDLRMPKDLRERWQVAAANVYKC